MEQREAGFAAELKKYVRNTQEIRTLSSVRVSKLKNSRDYAETLRDNFIRIRSIAQENRAILTEVLEPVLNSKEELTEEQVQGLKDFKQELLDAYSVENLDLPVMARTVTRLYEDALAKGDLAYMIEQLDAQIEAYYALSCYAARMVNDQGIAMEYVRRGETASEQFSELIRKEKFKEILDEDSRDIVLVNYRYMTAIYEGICNDRTVNDRAVYQFSNALKLLDDFYYRQKMPGYNWDYYELRILEYIATMSEGNNRRGFTKEQLQFAYECAERLAKKWNSAPEKYGEYITEGEMQHMLARNRYMVGRIDKQEYKQELLKLYAKRNENSYQVDDVYANVLIPVEYIGLLRNETINERERRILLDFYRRLVSYAHNTTNSGELTVILNYYYLFLTCFIEVSDEFTMEDMCMESFAALHPPTYIHSNMVALFSSCLCRHLLKKKPELFVGVLGCGDTGEVKRHEKEILERIYHGALVHDVGKLAIIDTIFVYGRNITDEEFQLIRSHPEAGYHLAAEGTSIATYRDIILGHHRFYDEKGGYPRRESEERLPDKVLIDIVTLADCMDAATDTVGRSYARGKTLEQFLEELKEGAGTRYSPDVVELFADPAVYEDIQYLLTEGREKIYSDTYYLLKNVQEHGENWKEEEDPIEEFRDFLRQKSKYESAMELVHFDLETYAPEKGLTEKAETLALLSVKRKEHLTAAGTGRLFRQLAKLEIEDEGLKQSYAILQEEFNKQRRVPNDFYEEFVREQAISAKAWERAKQQNDFSIFEPYLEKMISMTRKQCSYTDPDQECYDVLLDKYERGMDQETIDGLFADMKQGLNELLDRIEGGRGFDPSIMEGDYDIEGQRKVSRMLLEYIGFDSKAGVAAESVHPFSTRVSYGDIRLTNAYSPKEAINGMFTALHEGGHALFEQGIDPKYRYTEIEHVNWMGLHECQSRFYENILGRNIAFWKPIYPEIQRCLPKFQEIDLGTFERAINDVRRSPIRLEADEVTYGLHIILRYEMEKAIFIDQVPVRELPELWREKSRALLGIVPEKDAEGILQDAHWSDGSFGYFPSYLLGSIYGGMLLKQIEKELGSIDTILERGEVRKITEWLQEHIFRHGRLYTARELIPRLCGKEITAADLLDYFNQKCNRIYFA